MSKVNIKNNTAVYSGGVKVIIKEGNKTKVVLKHNNGTLKLAQFLSNALAGRNTVASMPSRIKLFSGSPGSYSELTSPVPFDGTIEQTDSQESNSASVALTFFIAGSSVVGSGGTVTKAALYAANNNDPYAEVVFDSENQFSISPNINVQLTWTLTVAAPISI